MVRMMPYFTFCLTILIGLFTVANASAQSTFGPARLHLTTQDWPPYQDYKHGQMQGLALDKVKCALSHMGQPYQITTVSYTHLTLPTMIGV